MVEVNGIGDVLPSFRFETDKVNWFTPNYVSNHHDEKQVRFECREEDEWWNPNDKMIITASSEFLGNNISAYKLTIEMDSEVPLSLWRNGKIELTYDVASQKWSMKGISGYGGAEWRFCSPDAVVDMVLDGLRCAVFLYGAGEDALKDSTSKLIRSLEAGRNHLIKSAVLYPAEDCSKSITDELPTTMEGPFFDY